MDIYKRFDEAKKKQAQNKHLELILKEMYAQLMLNEKPAKGKGAEHKDTETIKKTKNKIDFAKLAKTFPAYIFDYNPTSLFGSIIIKDKKDNSEVKFNPTDVPTLLKRFDKVSNQHKYKAKGEDKRMLQFQKDVSFYLTLFEDEARKWFIKDGKLPSLEQVARVVLGVGTPSYEYYQEQTAMFKSIYNRIISKPKEVEKLDPDKEYSKVEILARKAILKKGDSLILKRGTKYKKSRIVKQPVSDILYSANAKLQKEYAYGSDVVHNKYSDEFGMFYGSGYGLIYRGGENVDNVKTINIPPDNLRIIVYGNPKLVTEFTFAEFMHGAEVGREVTKATGLEVYFSPSVEYGSLTVLVMKSILEVWQKIGVKNTKIYYNKDGNTYRFEGVDSEGVTCNLVIPTSNESSKDAVTISYK